MPQRKVKNTLLSMDTLNKKEKIEFTNQSGWVFLATYRGIVKW